MTRLKDEAMVGWVGFGVAGGGFWERASGDRSGGLEEDAVDGLVEADLLAEGDGEGGGALHLELDVDAGGEAAVDDAGEVALAEVADVADLGGERLEGVLEALDDGLGGVGDAAEVEDEGGAVGALVVGLGLLGHVSVVCW